MADPPDEVDLELQRTVQRVRSIRRRRQLALAAAAAVTVVVGGGLFIGILVIAPREAMREGTRFALLLGGVAGFGLGFLVYRRLDPRETEDDV